MLAQSFLNNISDIQQKNFYLALKNKIAQGFVISEQNEKVPYIVLRREKQPIDHFSYFLLCCATIGFWSVFWLYDVIVKARTKEILLAIDDDGNIFEENCYLG